MNKFWYELKYNGKVINKFLHFNDLWRSYRALKNVLRPDERELLTYDVIFAEGVL